MAFFTPLIIGFFSGFHCIAMCGGLCAALCHKQNNKQVLITNLGRVTTYTLLGALFAGLVQGASLSIPVVAWGFWLRMLMGVMLVLTAAALFFKNHRLLTIQKPLPGWSKVSKKLQQLQSKHNSAASFFKGMLWGLIPCGLLYGMLIIAATTADTFSGLRFMLFFGLGTILPLLASQWAIRSIMERGSMTFWRRTGALFILIIGLWVLMAPWLSHGLIPGDNPYFYQLSAVLDMCVP
ncbi:MAG: sulfite exporter TauE/SafE family protein [Proteobacteria bacterium]|nr:MAG: sulfite exporter TauE/SafE family protein [Pseudomonadota bacterium]